MYHQGDEAVRVPAQELLHTFQPFFGLDGLGPEEFRIRCTRTFRELLHELLSLVLRRFGVAGFHLAPLEETLHLLFRPIPVPNNLARSTAAAGVFGRCSNRKSLNKLYTTVLSLSSRFG